MNRWYLQSVPERDKALMLAVIVVLADLAAVAVWLAWGRWIERPSAIMVFLPFMVVAPGVCCFAAGAAGIFRFRRFPTDCGAYHLWLGTTPWTPKHRTPFGPWHPVLKDLIPLGILGLVAAVHVGLIAWFQSQSMYAGVPHDMRIIDSALCAMMAPLVVFLATWIGTAYLFVAWQWNWSIYVPVLGLGVLAHLLFWVSETVFVTVLLVLVVCGVFAVWKRLFTVLNRLNESTFTNLTVTPIGGTSSPVFELLSPRGYKSKAVQFLELLRSKSLAVGILLLVCLTIFPWKSEMLLLLAISGLVFAMVRLAIVADRHSSHLSLAARWGTRRLIVPEYDKIFLPPLYMVITSWTLLVLGYFKVVSLSVACPLSIIVPLMIGIVWNPDFERWSLTTPVAYFLRGNVQQSRK